MIPRRGTKLRAFTASGGKPDEHPSLARPHKPPAKAISARKAAALKTGGGKLPPKVRERLEKRALPERVHPSDSRKRDRLGPTRYGKREPKVGRDSR